MKITLDKEREVVFTTRSLLDAERKLGYPVLHAVADPSKMASIEVITTLLWAGMRDDVDYEDVVDMVPIDRYNEVIEVIVEAIEEALPESDGKKKKQNRSERRSKTSKKARTKRA